MWQLTKRVYYNDIQHLLEVEEGWEPFAVSPAAKLELLDTIYFRRQVFEKALDISERNRIYDKGLRDGIRDDRKAIRAETLREIGHWLENKLMFPLNSESTLAWRDIETLKAGWAPQ